MDILVYGTGRLYQQYKKWLRNVNILAFLDSDINKQGKILDGIKIISPQNGMLFAFDFIYVLSNYYDVMVDKLIKLGVDKEKIKSVRNLLELGIKPRYMEFGRQRGNTENNILFFSHELSLIGAPIVLFYAAEILRQSQFYITVASPSDGPLRLRYQEKGIRVIIDESLDFKTMEDIHWINDYFLIFVNSIDWTHLLVKRPKNLSVIWWLHEEKGCYTSLHIEDIKKIPTENLHIFSVSYKVKMCIDSYISQIKSELLLYCIPDEYEKSYIKYPTCFAVIGSVIPRKAQDTFLKAVKSLDTRYKNICQFWVIGDDSSFFASELKKMYDGNYHIEFKGECDRKKLMDLYRYIDVIICPSREDPMPVVVAEAAMMQKPSIVSEATGYANTFPDDFRGVIFKTDNVDELKKCMIRFINDKFLLKSTGKKMRCFFKQNFSKESFKEKLLIIMKDMIK
ncbi:glycosyltransferase [Pectinatus frisingensis]|uniref:glycosyltransferase n=1 Tax=Pectinatus frisingensis TaxID=865 RepID=UPI003D808DA4